MVNPFIVRVLAQVVTTLSKSAFRAYKRVISENIRKGAASSSSTNPFSEFLNKTMESTNLINKPMSQDEAYKILNLDGKETTPEQIMKSYMNLFKKNDPSKGGSFYLQSKVFCAKEFLMSEFPGEEEKYKKDQETLKSEEELKESEKEEENTEEKNKKETKEDHKA